ncbi:MAG: restriction endonuclease subunit S [Candidatus Nomurabacteria bacterium]|nr:MAG: restriction endonuclease subunit S [Candidatus Nomurabacteria bacterium]
MYTTPKTDFLTEEGAKLSRLMKKGDVVMAVSGNPGLPSILSIDACIHDGFVGFRALSSKLLPEFLYFVFLHQQEANNLQSVRAVFKNLTTDQIKQFEIPIPPLNIQKQIVEKIEAEGTLVESAKNLLKSTNKKPKR